MDLYQVVHERESIRDYDPHRPVEKDTLVRILEAGRVAPSAANRQPWKFIVVSTPEMLEKVRPCYPADWFRAAPHILVVMGERSEAWVRKSDGYNALETDLTIAMDHLILAAENEGVATCWIAAFNPVVLADALSLKEGQQVFAITPLGYPHEGFRKKGVKTRKPLEEVVRFL